MNEPQIECFDCMAAASGPHHGYKDGCKGCLQRAIALFGEPDHARIMRLLERVRDPAYKQRLESSSLFDHLPIVSARTMRGFTKSK
jgi:hypothetical protein